MFNLRILLATMTAVLLVSSVDGPVRAQLLPLPLPTRDKKPKPTATVTAVVPTRTPTRTPTPVATSAAPLPDMVPEISEVQLELATSVASGDVAEGCAESTSGVDLLRFTAASKNVGTADLVLGDPQCPSPCDEHPLEVCGNPDFVCSPAAGHNHPHYSNYARYELLDGGGNAVVVGHKQGFCLRDTNCASPVYTCTNQGISAGCYDVYSYSLGCQYLDVTGVPAGTYLLRVTIDPLNQIAELSESNNVTEQAVTITRPDATPVRTATPLQTATPVRTATTVRTPTPLPTATPAPSAPEPSATPAAVATGTITPTPDVAEPTVTPTPAANGALAAACQRALLKAGRTLVTRTIAGLDDCVAAVAGCAAPRRRSADCRAHAIATCAQGGDRIAAARATLAAQVAERCGALAGADLLGADGLAFERRSNQCRDEFDAGIVDAASVAACLVRHHVCRTGGLYQTEEPRSGARLRDGEAASAELCIDDLGGGLSPAALPELRGLDACSRAVRAAGRRFAAQRVARLQSCIAAHAGCLKPGVDREACERRAVEGCAARRDRLVTDAARLATTIERGCGELDFAALAAESGNDLAALAGMCAALGVPKLGSLDDYRQCLARQHACAVDDLLRFQAPRAAEWIGDWPPPGGRCPGAAD